MAGARRKKLAETFFRIGLTAMVCGLLSVEVTFAETAEQKKVKFIFNFGGPSTESPSGDVVYDQRTRQAKALYERAGYKVVILSDGADGNYPPTASGLRQAFEGELGRGGVNDLSVGFFGHGDKLFPSELQTFPRNERSQFPLTKQPRHLIGIDGWGNRGAESMAFAVSSPVGEPVGLGLFRSLLSDAKKKNPSLQTTVTALNCYSGMIGLELANEPAFNSYMSTFSSTTAKSVSLDPQADKRDGSKDVDYPYFLNQFLDSGLSYREAHGKAASALLDLAKKHGDRIPYATIPRSQIQQFVTRWCMENQSKKSTAKPPNAQLSGDFQLALNDLTQSTNEVTSYLENQAKFVGCFDKATIDNYRRLQKDAQSVIREVYAKVIAGLIQKINDLTLGGYLKSNLARRPENLVGGLATSEKMPAAKAKLVKDLTSLSNQTRTLPTDTLALRITEVEGLLAPIRLDGSIPMILPPRLGSHKCEKGNEISFSSNATEVIEKATRALGCLKQEPPTTETVNAVSWITNLEEDLCKRPSPLLNSLKQDQACVQRFFATVGQDDPAMKRLMEIFHMSQRGLFSGQALPARAAEPEHSTATSAK